MNKNIQVGLLTVVLWGSGWALAGQTSEWDVHDLSRPHAPVVTPGAGCSGAPSDAIVLFDGTDLSAWESCKEEGGDVAWNVKDEVLEVKPGAGDIRTRELFGSCQLHLEWCIPSGSKGVGQEGGNSGLFLMEMYEVQILNSFASTASYADGQAASVYGQNPPLVNVCRKLGEWQRYDLVFRAPVFEGEKVVKPAAVTVFQNGVLVQDHWELWGATATEPPAHYIPHAKKMPLRLQDHNNPIKFRNIWIRPLDD